MQPRPGSAASPDVLSELAVACRDCVRLRFEYTSHAGETSLRTTEPHRVVHDGRRWYLLAWDVDRADWRTFRVDRLKPRLPLGPRFAPRALPEKDVAAYVARGVQRATWDYRARVKVFAPRAQLAARLPASVVLEEVDARSCIAAVGADSPEVLGFYLAMLGADFEVLDGPELHAPLLTLGRRFMRAARSARAVRRGSRSRSRSRSA
jgi:predicted DNA-binding transcriptional regulator YafY